MALQLSSALLKTSLDLTLLLINNVFYDARDS